MNYEAAALIIVAVSTINAVLLSPVYVILSNLRADHVALRTEVNSNGKRIAHVEGQLTKAGLNDLAKAARAGIDS
jgi:hypothetical protein